MSSSSGTVRALAEQLAQDDDLRERLVNDPQAVLAEWGIPAGPDVVPGAVMLPSEGELAGLVRALEVRLHMRGSDEPEIHLGEGTPEIHLGEEPEIHLGEGTPEIHLGRRARGAWRRGAEMHGRRARGAWRGRARSARRRAGRRRGRLAAEEHTRGTFRRTRYLLFRCGNDGDVDLDLLLRGTLAVKPAEVSIAVSILSGGRSPLEEDDLDALLAVPSERWVPCRLQESPGGCTGWRSAVSSSATRATRGSPSSAAATPSSPHMAGTSTRGSTTR